MSLVNTVLNTIAAEAFKIAMDLPAWVNNLAICYEDLLKAHDKCVFNGNGYDPEWPDEAVKRGVWRIDAGCDAINELDSDKNIALFTRQHFHLKECESAKKSVLLGHYIGQVEMEALTMIDMINQHVIPSAKKADLGNPKKLGSTPPRPSRGAIAKIHFRR